jgi:hypothetical protein
MMIRLLWRIYFFWLGRKDEYVDVKREWKIL